MDRIRSAITFRSVVIGLVLMPLNNAYLFMTEIMWLTSSPTSLSIFANVVFVLFVLVLWNQAVKRWRPGWALQPGELFVIYSMLSIASALCSIDMLDYLVPLLSHITHFAPLEHRYDQIVAHMPEGLSMPDPEAATAFYLGQESIFDPQLYTPWIRPLFAWFWFVLALLAVMGGLILVFRKPWTQHEKLAYPIIQVPMQLVQEPRALLTNRVFWAGFALVAGLDTMNAISFFHPVFPHMKIVQVVNVQALFAGRPWTDMGWTVMSFFPFAIGLVYFIPLDLAFSCWFFFVVFRLQRVAASYFGVHGMPGFPYIEEQTAGGYYAIGLLALWMTRRHLRRLVRLALGYAVEDEEGGERGEARAATVLIAGGLAFLVAFSRYHGMAWGITLFYFASYFLVSVAVTRMRAELGYPSHDLHYIGPNVQMVRFLGAGEMARNYPRELVMFGFYRFFTRAYRAHPMPHGLEAMRIAERTGMNHRAYLAVLGLAGAVGTVVSFAAILWAFAKYGASNLSSVGEGSARETWDLVNTWFTAPEPHLPYPTYAIVTGLVFSVLLYALRMNLAWWPFHPVGYAVSGSWSMEQLWMSFMTGWLLKLVVMRFGGHTLYRAFMPFCIGMILAEFVVGTVLTAYGVVTAQNVYHFWPY